MENYRKKINNKIKQFLNEDREPISKLVKDEEWQKVRKSLKGKWMEDPEWCCEQLRNYLGNVSSTSDEKLRIVMNYLTGSGFRTGKIKHKCIQSLRDEISKEMKERKKK